MDDKLFKQKLSEVATWKIPDTPQETSLNAKKKRGRKSDEEKYQEEHEEIFMELYGGVNPTYAPMLIDVKRQPSACECGKICEGGCKKDFKLYHTKTGPVWRQKCLNCGMTKDPYTGLWNMNSQKASQVWASFSRDTNPEKKVAQMLEKQSNAEDAEQIRKYPDTEDPL